MCGGVLKVKMRQTVVLAMMCGCVMAQESLNTSLDTSRLQDRSEPRLGVVTNSYYDFLINEGSYKFWAVFQLVTIAILLYSTFAAIYYAKYNFLNEVQQSDVDDFFLRRSTRSIPSAFGWASSLDSSTFLRILDSVASLNLRYDK